MEKRELPSLRGVYQEPFGQEPLGSELAALRRICAGAQSLERLLRQGLRAVMGATGCSVGGVRLRQPDGSLPFYVSENLDPDFYRTEDLGNASECACGAVARGAALAPDLSTPFGSFIMNNLQAYGPALDTCRTFALRGRCVVQGYESVAIVPLGSEGSISGVIYLADPRRGVFTPERVAFLEAAATLLAAAIPRLRELGEEGPVVPDDSTQLLAALRHDLRTPLMPVKGLLNLVLAGKYGPLTPKQRELLDVCQLSIDREIDLIENLLESARLRSGRLQLERAVFDLRGATQDAVHYVEPLARERGCRIEVRLPAEELPVLGDRRRLLRVFANLLSNALKHGPAGGLVGLEASAEGREVVVRVADDGPGVPPEERERVFEWLYRGGASGGSGTGLGLAIARNVASLHGGCVWIESSQPSVFAVRLPLAPEPPADSERS